MKPLATSKIAARLLLPVILSLSTVQAAETVTWSELAKIAQKDQDYSILTKAGETFRGRQLMVGPSGVRFAESGTAIPREQVAEIHIRHHDSFGHALLAPAGKLFHEINPASGQDWYFPTYAVLFLPVLLPVALGIDVAATPFTAAAESARRLRPATVITVAP